MFCPYCGKENENDAVFCEDCGKSILDSPPEQKPAEPKAPVSKPVKERSPLIAKSTVKKILLALCLILLYAGISTLFIVMLNLENAITVKTIFDDDVTKSITLNNLLSDLISGNKVFNPTTLSLAFGMGLYALIYSVPAFALIAIAGAFCSKKTFAFYTVSSIITVLSVAASILIAPLSAIIIPGFKQAIAASAGVVLDDVGKITFIPIIIFSAIIIILLVASAIVTVTLKKEGLKNENQ